MNSLHECKSKCDESEQCISFEYWGQSNPHWNYGAGLCHASTSCIYELSEQAEEDRETPECHLYIKTGEYANKITNSIVL